MKILIIEDDNETRGYVSAGLKEAGHNVDSARDGYEGLLLAKEGKHDLLIVDRRLPDLDGLTLVKILRSAGCNVPVLFLTTMCGIDDRVEGLILVSVIDALSPVAEEQGKTIHADIDPDVTLTGDKELLTQLAFNLLDNAILHTPENTQIAVSLRSSGTQTELTIADNGPGIAEAYRQKVFQRFYWLEQSRTTPGNGLGLSIVAAIVDLHGGTIALSDNHPGLKIVLTFCNKKSDTR